MSQNKRQYQHLFVLPLLLISAYYIMHSFGLTMTDDGWRHLAMAFNQDEVKSWGHLFINSLYKEYDPWFMWHLLLNKTALLIGKENVPLFINTLVYFGLSTWVYVMLHQYSKLNIFFKVLFSVGLPLLTLRYYYLRPDLFSGFLLLSAVLFYKRKLLLFIIGLIYLPFYYVFWFYFIYLACVQFALKEYKLFFTFILLIFLGFAFHLSYDYDGYLHMMQNVLNNDKLIGPYAVTESQTFLIPDIFRQQLGSSKLLVLLMLVTYLCYLVFKPQNRLYQYTLLFIPLMLVQYRFFHLLQPLLMVCAIVLIQQSITKIQQTSIHTVIDDIIIFIKEKSYFGSINPKIATLLIFLAISYFFVAKYMNNLKFYNNEHQKTLTAQLFKNEEFKNKRIFLTAMNGSIFRAIYYNPTGQYMPNCSIGWVDFPPYYKEIYFKILTNNSNLSKKEFFDFIRFNNFDYIVVIIKNSHNMDFTSQEMENNGYYFQKIINDFLIFKRKIKKNKL